MNADKLITRLEGFVLWFVNFVLRLTPFGSKDDYTSVAEGSRETIFFLALGAFTYVWAFTHLVFGTPPTPHFWAFAALITTSTSFYGVAIFVADEAKKAAVRRVAADAIVATGLMVVLAAGGALVHALITGSSLWHATAGIFALATMATAYGISKGLDSDEGDPIFKHFAHNRALVADGREKNLAFVEDQRLSLISLNLVALVFGLMLMTVDKYSILAGVIGAFVCAYAYHAGVTLLRERAKTEEVAEDQIDGAGNRLWQTYDALAENIGATMGLTMALLAILFSLQNGVVLAGGLTFSLTLAASWISSEVLAALSGKYD